MTALARDYPSVRSFSTPSIKQLLGGYSIPAFATLRVRGVTQNATTTAENLNDALHEARTVIRNMRNGLNADASTRALNRLSELLDPENWDEEDAMPARSSIKAVFGAIAASGRSFTSLSIANGGLLKVTWIDRSHTITAVSRDDQRISWSKIEKTPDGFQTETGEGSVLEFCAAFPN